MIHYNWKIGQDFYKQCKMNVILNLFEKKEIKGLFDE